MPPPGSYWDWLPEELQDQILVEARLRHEPVQAKARVLQELRFKFECDAQSRLIDWDGRALDYYDEWADYEELCGEWTGYHVRYDDHNELAIAAWRARRMEEADAREEARRALVSGPGLRSRAPISK